jgi:hypothetical protein
MGLNWHDDQLRHEDATVLLDDDRSGLVGLGVGAQRGSGDAAIDTLLAFFCCFCVVGFCVYQRAPYIGVRSCVDDGVQNTSVLGG